MRPGTSAALILMLTACSAEHEHTTRVVVIVDAEEAVKAQASDLVLVVHDWTDGVPRLVHDDTDALSKRQMPRRIGLVPQGNDPRRTYHFEARAVADEKVVAIARLISGYVANETRYVRIVLEEACIGNECSDTETCHAGDCVAAVRRPESFASKEALAPLSASPVDDEDAAQPVEVIDGSPPEGREDAAVLPSEVGAPLQDAGTATEMRHPDASLVVQLDAGSAVDGAVDASSSRADAAVRTDAGASVDAAAVPAVCSAETPYGCYKLKSGSHAECPAQHPGNDSACAGLPVHIGCTWTGPQAQEATCTCDWVHWLCL